MKVELSCGDGTVVIGAVDGLALVARAEAPTLAAAVEKLVSRFAEMQRQTIEALNAAGLVHYVERPDDDSEAS